MAYIYPLLPIGAGALMLVLLARHLRFSAFLAVHGQRAEGEIIGYHETNTTAKMIVRFRTEDGREVQATHTSTGWTASRSGDRVTVSYHPGHPEAARIIDAPWLSSWVDTMFGALGVALIAIGCVLAYLAW